MKRTLTVLAAAGILILGAAACGDDDESTPPSTTTSAQSSTTTTQSATATSSQPPAPTPPPATPTTTGQTGADGSTGNNLSEEYCARNQDPGCPLGSYVGPDAIPNPNGDGTWVPCEGTICTNPNHGAGPDTTDPEPVPTTTAPPDQGPVEGAACEGDGTWVHLDGENADHYGTEWLCQH